MPGSPAQSTTRRRPASASSSDACSRASSLARPSSGSLGYPLAAITLSYGSPEPIAIVCKCTTSSRQPSTSSASHERTLSQGAGLGSHLGQRSADRGIDATGRSRRRAPGGRARAGFGTDRAAAVWRLSKVTFLQGWDVASQHPIKFAAVSPRFDRRCLTGSRSPCEPSARAAANLTVRFGSFRALTNA